jgi:hypothetical protein
MGYGCKMVLQGLSALDSYNKKMLILFAYPGGITSIREIAESCEKKSLTA